MSREFNWLSVHKLKKRNCMGLRLWKKLNVLRRVLEGAHFLKRVVTSGTEQDLWRQKWCSGERPLLFANVAGV